MNTKAIALLAVLAVALTGGFAIAGADAADGDDFDAEYWTEGPFEGVDATFETGLATQLTWWANVYGDEGAVKERAIVTVSDKLATFMWNAIPLEAGTYQVEIYNTAKTIVYKGSVVVPQTFTVTFAVDSEVIKTLPVNDGDYIATDQLPEDPVKGGQEFVGWAPEGATVAFNFANTPITQDYDFKALFKPKEYTITVDPAIENGTVTPSKLKAKAGEAISLTVLPAEGYQVASVTLDGAALEEYAFTMPNKNVTVSATFEPKEYTISVDPAIVNGTVIPDKEKAKAGETVTLTVTPAEGYQVASVTLDGVALEEYAFTMPNKNVTVSATFELKDYTITVDSEIDNGSVTADKEKAKAGETVTLTVKADDGYQLVSVTVNGAAIEGTTFEMPAENVTVSATFELTPVVKEYTITVDSEIEGGDVVPETVLAVEGATVTLSYTEDEGYTFVSYYAYTVSTETPITISDDGKFTMPAEDVIVGAYFLPDVPVKKYTVTVLPSKNGTASADVTEAEEGDLITITATPADSYQTAAIYVDGKPLLEGENTFLMPAKNVEVSAVFAEIPVGGSTVTYVDVNGFVETESYEIGEPVVYHVKTVPEGMKLGYVNFEPHMDSLIDQEECTVEFTAVEGNYTAMISYIAPFTVTVLDQKGEYINDYQYSAGEPVTIDMGTYLGAEVESATSEPEIEDFDCKDGVITFTMPAQDVTVTVTTKPIVPDTVKVVFIDGITEEEVSTKTVPVGTILEDVPEAPIHEDMTFTGWYRFGSDVPYNFATMPVMENMTVYAQYEDSPIIDTVTVTFYDESGETVLGAVPVEAGTLVPADKIPTAPPVDKKVFRGWMTEDLELFDFETEVVEDDMDVYAFYLPEPVIAFAVTFYDEDGVTVVYSTMVEKDDVIDKSEIPEPEKEGYNFVGWFKDGYEKSFDFTKPITEPVDVYAKYVETPQIEGFAVLYHDMYQGEPVDIWWKGYASKDERITLANGMDANPGVVFKGWLAEDQKTLLTWNAAYDLNDLDRNDCLIYPAYYGYPGTDGIYELNAIYELHIQWIGFDGETVIDEQDVERGKFLVPKYSDEDMTAMLEQEMPSDKQYKYSWAGWRIGDSETTYTSEQIGSVKVDGAWKIYATYGKDLNEYDITFNWHDGDKTITVAYGETPEIENPPAYEDDNFTYTFAGWDPEVERVTGTATYDATYDKTSKTKDVTITVNDFAYGYFTYNDVKQTADYILKVPMDAEAPVIDGNVLTFDFVIYENGEEVPETHVFTAFPNPDDTMHYEFIEWTVSEDGNTYTANFVTDIITSTDLDRIQTFFDYTDDEDGDFIFTMKSKDGLAIPKGKLVVKFYEYAYVEEVDAYVQIEDSFDAIEMDWGTYYGNNLISMTIEYSDLTQDEAPVDLTTKNINTMWLVFDGYNEAHCESNKATPGQ